MSANPRSHHRRSIRLQGYDYAQAGAYFVTICTHKRACLFGVITDNGMRPNGYGKTVEACWAALPRHYSYVELDAFVVMPNHVHAIIVLLEDANDAAVGAGLRPAPTDHVSQRHGLQEIVRAFKSFSARRINALRGTPGVPVWQRNYYERIIRNERELQAIREYIANNPCWWAVDSDNPANLRG